MILIDGERDDWETSGSLEMAVTDREAHELTCALR